MILATLLILAAYLLGSVSTAILVCRLMGLPDPRTQGSGNPGATNVLRIGGRRGRAAAAIALVGDSLKGFLPMLAGHLLEVSPLALAGIGLAAFLGHLYPVFFGFRGGKGVATALGAQFGLGWPIGLTVGALWLFVARVLKFSSLAALLSMVLAPAVVWFFDGRAELVGMQLVITGILVWRHRGNIRNLLTGREDRIGASGARD